jgi:hypothetical protein
MNEQIESVEKDHFILYLVLATVAMVSVIFAIKLNENAKFEPIKQQIVEENRLMNIRILAERED